MEYIFELEHEEDSHYGTDIEADLNELLEVSKDRMEFYDEDYLRAAFDLCLYAHDGQFRKSGKPYYTHPLNVALILLKEFPVFDKNSVVSCLLHDAVEDSEIVDLGILKKMFEDEVADIVDAVTKISHDETSKELNKASTYRKLFLSLVKDVRVILIKLADRLHNMRTLGHMTPKKQNEIAKETLNFYTPLAHRLGLNKIKMELENRSFYFSERETYEKIRSELKTKRMEFVEYIKVFYDLILNSLNEKGMDHTITIVHKHEYQIYEMIQDGQSLEDIDNFYSMVIVLDTDDVSECYKAHGILANTFNSISFADYIVNPKMDWFQSLNCELYGLDGKKIEILIRNREMEKIAEEGFASAFSLKSGSNRALKFSNDEVELWGAWMQNIIEEQGAQAKQIIWNSIKVNLFDSELVVYSKDGKPTNLPRGASIIDYAFSLSNDKGLHLISAKVNGKYQDLTYKLQSGDQIEIIASPNVFPRLDWQNHVITHKAVVQLYFYFQQHPPEDPNDEDEIFDYDVMLRIKGEDRDGLLNDITNAVGLAHIKRINLDANETKFEGAITLNIHSKKHLNILFQKLTSIKGVKSIKKLDILD